MRTPPVPLVPAEGTCLNEQKVENEGRREIGQKERTDPELHEEIGTHFQRDAQTLPLLKSHRALALAFMTTMSLVSKMVHPTRTTISNKSVIATRSIRTRRFREIPAIKNRGLEDVADVEDVLNQEGAKVQMQLLIRGTRLVNAMTMMQAISSARTAGFHLGRTQSERSLPPTWKTINGTSRKIVDHAVADHDAIGS